MKTMLNVNLSSKDTAEFFNVLNKNGVPTSIKEIYKEGGAYFFVEEKYDVYTKLVIDFFEKKLFNVKSKDIMNNYLFNNHFKPLMNLDKYFPMLEEYRMYKLTLTCKWKKREKLPTLEELNKIKDKFLAMSIKLSKISSFSSAAQEFEIFLQNNNLNELNQKVKTYDNAFRESNTIENAFVSSVSIYFSMNMKHLDKKESMSLRSSTKDDINDYEKKINHFEWTFKNSSFNERYVIVYATKNEISKFIENYSHHDSEYWRCKLQYIELSKDELDRL